MNWVNDRVSIGIIPARAGFTQKRWRPCPHFRDHPRSRGVYNSNIGRMRAAHGSSPLARGLPQPQNQRIRGRRIIPARAGFTTGPSGSHGRARDHPRSRGVYTTRARALSRARWIIPARAGFTPRGCCGLRGRRDHPRSRGVYPVRARASRACSGSSPLARGLLPGSTCPDGGRRIIPARAGFTPAPSARWPEAGDHPRSRGVYPRG